MEHVASGGNTAEPFYNEFLSTYPYYEATLLELTILHALTQFLPRILEQSLLNALTFVRRAAEVTRRVASARAYLVHYHLAG
jgi:hypothetical protein